MWRLALSRTARASREWRCSNLVSRPFHWYGSILALGAFGFSQGGHLPRLLFGAGLWCLMGMPAAHLWWLGKLGFTPERSDIGFSNGRAAFPLDLISCDAGYGNLHHPVGLILSSQDFQKSMAMPRCLPDPSPSRGRVFFRTESTADPGTFQIWKNSGEFRCRIRFSK